MGYIDDFLKDDDEEETPWWEQGDTNAAPAAISGIDPNENFEEDISNQLAASPAPGGNLDAYTPADDQAFKQFIGETADPNAITDSADPFSDQDKQKIGRRFDQEAFADQRAELMRHDNGFNGDDMAIGGIAAALDLMFNKGRDLGGIASGMGQGIAMRQDRDNQKIKQLGENSVALANADRQIANDESRQQYYDHNQQMQDKRFARDDQRYADAAPDREAASSSAQSDATLKALDAMFASEHGGFEPGEFATNQRADAAVTRAAEQEQYNRGRDSAADARAGAADKRAADAAARADAKSKEGETKVTEAMAGLPDWVDVTDPEALKVYMSDPVMRRKLMAAIQGGDASLDSMQGMMDERAGGPMLPFLDEKRAGDYDLKRRGVFGGLSPFAQLGTLQKSDIDMLEPTIPQSANVKDIAAFWGEDPNSDALAGGNKALRDMVSRGMGTAGLTPNYDKWAAARAARNPLGMSGQTPAPPVQPNATAGRPGKDPALTLPDDTTTPGGPPMPAIRLGGKPVGAPSSGSAGLIGTDNGDGTVTVKFPDGRTGTYNQNDPRLKSRGVIIQ